MAVSRGTRAWMLWTSALLGLIALAWMGAMLVVHVRVGRDLAELKRTAPASLPKDVESSTKFERWPKGHLEAFERLQNWGCPALPRLIEALDPAEDAIYMTRVSTLIYNLVLLTHGDPSLGPARTLLVARMNDLHIGPEEAPEERERKIRELRRWWKEEGCSRHPAWRLWTSDCLKLIATDF